jgi:hypothetical protein
VWLPLVGASGKDSNRIPLGCMRTYAHVLGEFSPEGWIEAVREGRTFASSAPLVDLQVNGHRPGETIVTESAVMIAARVESLVPVDRLEILANGEVIASAPGKLNQQHGTWSVELQHSFTPNQSVWIAARCIGQEGFAHTSFIKVRVESQPYHSRAGVAESLASLVEQTREWAELQGRYTNKKRREQLIARCDEAIGRLKTPR